MWNIPSLVSKTLNEHSICVLQTTHPKASILGGNPKLRNTYFVMGQLKTLVTEI
jgi:hypothetical protein